MQLLGRNSSRSTRRCTPRSPRAQLSKQCVEGKDNGDGSANEDEEGDSVQRDIGGGRSVVKWSCTAAERARLAVERPHSVVAVLEAEKGSLQQ